MKHINYSLALFVVGIVVLAGCGGGSKTHWIGSPYDGTIRGVETAPPDGDTNVGVDTWVEVYWPDYDYAPPPRFTFRLERETYASRFEAVRTTQEDSDPDGGSWWFAPERYLAFDAVYRITVTDSYGNRYRAYFITEDGRSRTETRQAGKSYKPEGAKDRRPSGTPAEEHTVNTGR